jgi:hypothetical protein
MYPGSPSFLGSWPSTQGSWTIEVSVTRSIVAQVPRKLSINWFSKDRYTAQQPIYFPRMMKKHVPNQSPRFGTRINSFQFSKERGAPWSRARAESYSAWSVLSLSVDASRSDNFESSCYLCKLGLIKLSIEIFAWSLNEALSRSRFLSTDLLDASLRFFDSSFRGTRAIHESLGTHKRFLVQSVVDFIHGSGRPRWLTFEVTQCMPW